MQNEKILGIPIHIALILLGIFASIIIFLPLWIWYTRKRKQIAEPGISAGRSEKLKSDIILSAIEDGVMVIGAGGLIQVFNPGATKITGWKSAEAIGLDHHLVMKFVDRKGEIVNDRSDPLKRVFATKTTIRTNDLFLVTRSSKRISLGLAVSPLLDAGNIISGAVIIFRDISQEKQEQAARAEFISTASHEMRTPVAAIEGYLALALNENVSKIDTKAREYLEKAHTSTQHLGKLFQDLLTSAKAEDGRLSDHPTVIEVGAFLEQLSEDLKFAVKNKGLNMEFIIGTPESTIDASRPTLKVVRPLYFIYADAERIRELITNLFDNAVKYTDSGKISIGITGNHDIVQVRVADTGLGIAPEDTPHLFEKFYRIDSSATRTAGGTGLGLFICRKIVELYNGRIWVDSTLGKGSTFYVNLPRLSTERATQLQAQQANRSVLEPEIGNNLLI